MAQLPFNVVDKRLAAGRGEEFSAGRLRDNVEERVTEEGLVLPINQRIEDSIDADGLQVANVHEAIPDDNKGFQMLQRMGWKGQGLGSKEDGIVEPVGGGAEAGVRLGLGKQEEDNFYTAADNIQRKRLEVEIQADEDEARTAQRELQAEREQQIKADVSNIKRTFYCEVCHKQYSSAAELDVHLSSYDHHHRKRMVEMRSAEYERTRKDRDRREKKRRDKEMARLNEQIQKAKGDPGGSEQPPPPPDMPPPSDAPPPPNASPPPPLPAEEILPRTQGEGVSLNCPPETSDRMRKGGSRDAVQFIMSASQKMQAPGLGGKLGVRKPPIRKGKLQSKVAAFALDSDDEG